MGERGELIQRVRRGPDGPTAANDRSTFLAWKNDALALEMSAKG